jgi:hypothetical protein
VWKEQTVETATAGGRIQFYVNPDKNGSMVRMEIVGKALCTFLESSVANKKFYLRNQTGTVFVDKRPLFSVVITGELSGRLDWNHPKRIELGLDQGVLEERFKTLVAVGGKPSS